jgi:hypothetical protein
MVVRAAHTTVALCALLFGLTGTRPARADANALASLTTADGSVRAQASVQLALDAIPGARDEVVAMGSPIRARMPALRQCLADSMAHASTSEGRVTFEVEARSRGAARLRLLSDTTKNPVLVACLRRELAATRFTGVTRGARAALAVTVHNPLAALQQRAQPRKQEVRMLGGGRAESAGGTEDLRFRVSGSAYAARSIAGIAQGLSDRVATLLDCRRKASRHDQAGSITLDLRLRAGELAHGASRSTVKASASRCIASLVTQLDTKSLADADLELAVSFAVPR